MTNRLAGSAVALALLALVNPSSAQTVAQRRALTASLESPNPQVREGAFEQLRQVKGGLAAPGMAPALLALLERENELIASTWKNSHGTVGIVDKYGEGFGEYMNDLAVECAALCRPRTHRVLLALAQAFPASSDVARELAADHGPELIPVFLEKARTGDEDAVSNATEMIGSIDLRGRTLSQRDRAVCDSLLFARLADTNALMGSASAAEMLGKLVAAKHALSSERRAAIHSALVAGTSHPDMWTRSYSVSGLANFHDVRDLPLLDDIAARDPYTRLNGAVVRHDVREEAAKAAAIVRQP